tara:strand:- start:110 stop:211 length:102 start_codon:yes stop_codon:yes gene_type:complete
VEAEVLIILLVLVELQVLVAEQLEAPLVVEVDL